MRLSGQALLLVALLGLVACGDKDPSGDEPGEETDPGAGGDDTGEAPSDDAPYVIEVRAADCVTNGDSVDIWNVELSVGDPQGDIDRTASTITVLDGDTELASYLLACSPDSCTGSWNHTYDGVTCDIGRAATFRAVIVDEFGNASAPYDFQPS